MSPSWWDYGLGIGGFGVALCFAGWLLWSQDRRISTLIDRLIQVQLRGPDITELNRLAPRLADLLRATPGAVDVGLSTKGQKPEIDVELDRPLAGTLGVTVGQVAQSLRPAFAGIDAGALTCGIASGADQDRRGFAVVQRGIKGGDGEPVVVRGRGVIHAQPDVE